MTAGPGEPDPDDRRLYVEVTQEVEWEEIIDLDAVKAGPIVIGLRHDRADQDLEQQQCGDDKEILAGRKSAGK